MDTRIDMRIAGSGKIPAGEYDKVSVSGSGKLLGKVRCESFSSSGSAKGEEIECAEGFRVSGSAHFSGNIRAETIKVSGSLHTNGAILTNGEFTSSGSTRCDQSIKCAKLSVSGSLKVDGGIEAESVQISGVVNCGGLLNAESIRINFDRGMQIESIGGSKIIVAAKNAIKGARLERLPLFASLVKSAAPQGVVVNTSIEGDEVALEYTACPRVSGRVVAIGQGCCIDLVQYCEEVEISPDARVERVEKL